MIEMIEDIEQMLVGFILTTILIILVAFRNVSKSKTDFIMTS